MTGVHVKHIYTKFLSIVNKIRQERKNHYFSVMWVLFIFMYLESDRHKMIIY